MKCWAASEINKHARMYKIPLGKIISKPDSVNGERCEVNYFQIIQTNKYKHSTLDCLVSYTYITHLYDKFAMTPYPFTQFVYPTLQYF